MTLDGVKLTSTLCSIASEHSSWWWKGDTFLGCHNKLNKTHLWEHGETAWVSNMRKLASQFKSWWPGWGCWVYRCMPPQPAYITFLLHYFHLILRMCPYFLLLERINSRIWVTFQISTLTDTFLSNSLIQVSWSNTDPFLILFGAPQLPQYP